MFRLLGFDVRVGSGFVIFLALIVFLYSSEFGVWLAGSLAVFTLIHELGHAVAARSAGADASISLGFLAGYTSFRADPTRPISRSRRAVISASGPLVQIAVSCGVLLAMGVDPTSRHSALDSAQSYAIWWAGPVIGVLNLIPVLPLDGGHLALTALEGLLGERAMRAMAVASLALTGGFAAWMFVTGRSGFAIFVAFLLINQFQILQATSERAPRPLDQGRDADAAAWRTGRRGLTDLGTRLSPWFEASNELEHGRTDRAVMHIVDDLRRREPVPWVLAPDAPIERLRAVVEVLPGDLPVTNPYGARVLADVLLAVGEPQSAGEYAVRAFSQHRTPVFALDVARAAAVMGDDDNAHAWIDAALGTLDGLPDHARALTAATMDRAPEFARLRGTDRFTAQRIAV